MKYIADELGQDIVEYALVLPMLLLLMFGIIEFSVVFFNYNTISNAAREGARVGIRPFTATCDSACRDAEVDAAAHMMTIGLNPDELAITITRPSATTIRVQVRYNVRLITGFIIAAIGGQDTITVGTTATMQRE